MKMGIFPFISILYNILYKIKITYNLKWYKIFQIYYRGFHYFNGLFPEDELPVGYC